MKTEFGGPVVTETFTASGVYDKVAWFAVLAILAGAVGYLAASPGLVLAAFIGGLVTGLIGIFKPAYARAIGTVYALLMGLALGGITAAYATQTNGIAPLAIIFTGGVFLAALVVFRSGLVKVTPRFVSMTIMAGFGFLLVLLAGLIGVPFVNLSSQSGMLVIGVIGLLLGVMYLFVDFNAIAVGEQQALPVQAEWYAAFTVLMSLVFVYINVLRVLGRGGRR
ncbi:MAG: Bax inhibitor-1/YccA family membrane protein [Candidatus Limnocylindrales bacterium]